MSVAEVEALLRARLPDFSSLNATVKIELGDDRLYIDGTQRPATLSHDDADADCTLTVSTDNLQNMLNGSLDPTMAFMTGKLKISGSTGIAMKLAGILRE
jgi:putative sterol carrier protein